MTMDKAEGVAAMEVERFSKLGTMKLQQGHPQKALDAYRKAFESAQTLGHHGYMQRACAFNLGAMLISTGKHNEGLIYLNKAVPPEGRKDGRSNGDLYFNFGLAYEGLQNVPESIRYFEKALGEYRTEYNNLKVEADTIHRLGKLCTINRQYSQAEAWIKQLIQTYDNLGNSEKRLQAQVERINLLLQMGSVDDAEEMADDCLKGTKTVPSAANIGHVLNELGLVYTQMSVYEKALECYESALNLAETSSGDQKLVTVLYQNLGAVYNYMGRFEDAIKYHQAAAERHADLKHRKSQGHCFINMGHAYSQLKDIDKAGECFLHSLQAAKDCGDRKSEWQSLEALGSVAFLKGSVKSAQDYFKQALTVIGKSPNGGDNSAQERIFGKLTSCIQNQDSKLKPKSPPATETTGMIKQVEQIQEIVVDKEAKETETRSKTPTIRGKQTTKSQTVIAVKREGKIKYLRVRRSGTLRQFKKVALGLDPSFSPTPTQEFPSLPHGFSEGDDEEILSVVDTSEEEDESNDYHVLERPPDSYHRNAHITSQSLSTSEQGEDVEYIVEDQDKDDSDEDEKNGFRAELEKQLRETSDGMNSSQGIRREVIADVHADGRKIDEEEDEYTDDSDSDSTSSGSSDEEEEESGAQKGRVPPPVPTKSPGVTYSDNVRTYEMPASSELHYETIDHSPRPGTSQGNRTKNFNAGERSILSHRPSDDDGHNFFHGGLLKDTKRLSGNEEKVVATGVSDGTIYESIQFPKQESPNTQGAGKASGDEADDESGSDTEPAVPRGESEKRLFEEHQKAQERNQNADLHLDTKNEKSSKVCIVM